MRYRVESGELSLDLDNTTSHHGAAVQALKVWHAAEERICLSGVLTVKQLGPRGGVQNEKIFLTPNILDELQCEYIITDGEVITMPQARPDILKVDDVAGSKWLSLKRATYQWPDESSKSWEYVTRPTRKGEIDAVVVVPFLKDPNRIVIIREFRVPINDYEIAFVAGLVDEGETPVQAAKRELREETGLTMGKVLTVSPPLFSTAGMTDENVVMVFCEVTGEIEGVQSEEEKIEVVAIDLKGVNSILQNPPCSMSAKLWPVLSMMSMQGYIGWGKQ
jgi:ADP-ribose pyrophosphatase